MIGSRCGLNCETCQFRESTGCAGCVESGGNPFHGKCPVAQCSIGKGLRHCGECPEAPCEKLYMYSYLDKEHGDKPQGERVQACRKWAAMSGIQKWENVLLTSGGFEEGAAGHSILRRFYKMLGKPAKQARVLLAVPAAGSGEAPFATDAYIAQLSAAGIRKSNIIAYALDGSLSESDAMGFDVVFVMGENPGRLLKQMKSTGFDKIVKAMVYANKVYVGAGAGSLVATPNIGAPFDNEGAALCFVNAYLRQSAADEEKPCEDSPLPRIALSGGQALAVSWRGYELIDC